MAVSSGALLQQAEAALSQGRPGQAAVICEDILRREGRNTAARYFLGLAHALNGELDSAVSEWERLLRIQPKDFSALANLGAALSQQGRHTEAIQRLRAALALDASQAQVHYNLGTAYQQLGRAAEAGAAFAAALGIDPGFTAARASLDSALQALYHHAVTLHRAGRLQAAVHAYEQMLSIQPEIPQAWRDRGRALESLQRLGAALDSYAKALALAPHDPHSIAGALSCSVRVCEWTLAEHSLRQLRGLPTGLEAIHPFLALSVCTEPAEQLRISQSRPRTLASSLCPRVPHDRLRIAYVSSDFRDHAVIQLLVGVLEQHDRRTFEIHAVSLQPEDRASAIGRRLRDGVEHYHDVSQIEDAAVATRLRDLEIDIAVDLNGYTIGGRPEIFARRCAPVQVGYLGYAGTTGAPYIDYLVADNVVIPPGEEAHYSERIVRLPGCYLPNDDRREIALIPPREHAGLVFCAFTNAYKITAPVFDIWMRLLRETPGSILWLRAMGPEATANLQREARARGVDARRLVFAPHVAGMAEHLARLSLADLYLDTFPYNAHSTTCDALWAGVPVLTCAGRSFASRVAASALTAVGLPELITYSLEEYERRALELARKPREPREKLARQRSGAPLFNTKAYCRNLETAFVAMLQAS